MFIKGRAIFTRNHIMLDEVRSLLQKSLRRKENVYAAQCVGELVQADRDQLPWRCLLTFLFEDHCLVSNAVLTSLYSCIQTASKVDFVKTLLRVRTCRVAASLAVFAMHPGEMKKIPPLSPLDDVDQHGGLVSPSSSGCVLNADGIMAMVLKAWRDADHTSLILSVKLASLMEEVEGRAASEKGVQLVTEMLRSEAPKTKKHVGIAQVVLAVMNSATEDAEMRRFLFLCQKFSFVKQAPTRLILFSAVARLCCADRLPSNLMRDAKRDWTDVSPLTEMPSWAVDKHTHRGKGFVLKDDALPMGVGAGHLEEFFGPRPPRDIEYFFSHGVIEASPALDVNPFWEKTKAVYRNAPKSRRKTVYIGREFVGNLQTERKDLFVCGKEKLLPLLQVPTSCNKVYTRCNLAEQTVIKGPYKRASPKYENVLRNHAVLRDVLGDLHTQPVTKMEENGQRYLSFPLIKEANKAVSVTKKTFWDLVSRTKQTDVDFVEREMLGVTQVHNMTPSQVKKLPLSVWRHYALRYALNIGDSGLFNAIYDGERVIGVDMDEVRRSVKDDPTLCDLLFTKKPRKPLCEEIEEKIKSHKDEFAQMLRTARKDGQCIGGDFEKKIDILMKKIE